MGFFIKQTNTGYGNDAKSLETRKMWNIHNHWFVFGLLAVGFT